MFFVAQQLQNNFKLCSSHLGGFVVVDTVGDIGQYAGVGFVFVARGPEAGATYGLDYLILGSLSTACSELL